MLRDELWEFDLHNRCKRENNCNVYSGLLYNNCNVCTALLYNKCNVYSAFLYYDCNVYSALLYYDCNVYSALLYYTCNVYPALLYYTCNVYLALLYACATFTHPYCIIYMLFSEKDFNLRTPEDAYSQYQDILSRLNQNNMSSSLLSKVRTIFLHLVFGNYCPIQGIRKISKLWLLKLMSW